MPKTASHQQYEGFSFSFDISEQKQIINQFCSNTIASANPPVRKAFPWNCHVWTEDWV